MKVTIENYLLSVLPTRSITPGSLETTLSLKSLPWDAAYSIKGIIDLPSRGYQTILHRSLLCACTFTVAFEMLLYSRVGQSKCGEGPEVSFNGIEGSNLQNYNSKVFILLIP
jgi:hypothetical protein